MELPHDFGAAGFHASAAGIDGHAEAARTLVRAAGIGVVADTT